MDRSNALILFILALLLLPILLGFFLYGIEVVLVGLDNAYFLTPFMAGLKFGIFMDLTTIFITIPLTHLIYYIKNKIDKSK